MSTRYHETISINKISGIRKHRPKKIHSNYEISSRLKTITPQSLSDIHYGNTSTILQEYEQSLKTELQTNKLKELQRKERKKHQTIETLLEDKRQYRTQSKKLISQLQSIKYRLKTIGLQRQSDFRSKQSAVLIKQSLEGQNRNYPLFPNLSSHLHYPYPYPYPPPPNPYHRYQPMYDSQMNLPQNYQRSLSQSERTYQKKHRMVNSSQNDDQYPKDQAKISSKPKDSKIITKTQFSRSKFKKRINDFKRFQNKQQNTKRLRKCFLAVYFSVVLRKDYLKIVKQRKKFFLQFWPQEFFKFQESFKEYFYSKFLPFFKLLKEKQYTSLLPAQQDTKVIQLQKKKTVRQLVRLFFQCLRPFKNVQNLGKVAWGFCSNGSFAGKGVLTVNEKQFVSFDETHGYLRMDKNLQKSQIISFIFIKTVLFKFLLHPWKKWQKQYNPSENKLLIENLKFVSSILYDLFVTLQDEYMSSADLKMYPVGNYDQVKRKNDELFIQFSKPLLYETKKAENEIISGLYSQQFLKKNIGLKKILPYLQVAKQVIEGIHTSSKQYDRVFRSKVLKYVPKVNYKY